MTEKVSTTITYHGRGKWSQEATKLLVALYEQHPCLYQRINPHYRNKQVRQHALITITNLLDKAIHMNFTTRDVLTKINSIRTQFSVVHNSRTKRLAQLTNANDMTKIKQPSWWLYPHLKFLIVNCRKSDNKRQGRSEVQQDEETTNNSTKAYENKESLKHEIIELDEGEEEDSEEEQPELRLAECYEQEYIDAEQKIEPNVVMVNPSQAVVHEVIPVHVDGNRSVEYHSETMEMRHEESLRTPEPKSFVERNDYVTVTLNHLKLELESLRSPQTQRMLLRKMFQLIYDAQDQE